MARHDKAEASGSARGAESIANFYGRASADGRSGSVRSRKHSSSGTNYVDLPRSSFSTEGTSNRFLTDDEGTEEIWADAQDRGPKVYSTFFAAAAASRSSLSQRPSLPHLPASSPQARSQQSQSNSPVPSSPLTPASSSGAIIGHRPKQSSVKRLVGLGQSGGSPTGPGASDAFVGPASFSSGEVTKQASWSGQPSSTFGPSRKSSEQSLTFADLGPRRDSASGVSRTAPSAALRPRTSAVNGQRIAEPHGGLGPDDGREGRLIGLGLGDPPSSSDVSEFEQGRGYGWNPERERSRSGKDGLRDDRREAMSRKGSLAPLGRSGLANSEVDLARSSRTASSGSQRLHPDVGRPSQDVVAMSIEQEQAMDSDASSAPRTSAFAKLFRRKGKQSGDGKPASPVDGSSASTARNVSPAIRQIRRTASQNVLQQQRAASIDDAPLMVVSPKMGPPPPPPPLPPPPPPSAAAVALDARRTADDGSRPSQVHRREEASFDEPGSATPRPAAAGAKLGPEGAALPALPSDERERPIPSLPEPQPAYATSPSEAGGLRVDTTPIPGRNQPSPSTPLSRSSVHRHMKQSSIDSSSSSARRRSLAFLASAITMGSIADQQAAGDDRASPRNLSSSSLDLHRPSTAIGTVSPAVAGASSESKPGLAPPIGEPLHKPLSSGLPTVESPTEDARPSPMRNPNRPRLVAKGATREDAVPSALTEFLKMDAATPGGNGRAKVHKTAAAMYADAYRSSSDEDGPDIQKPASRQPDRSAPKRKGKEEDTEHAVARHKGKAPSGRRGSADHRSGMSNLSRAESGRSTAGSSEAKRSALSVSPKASRAAVKGTFSAAPAGPSMGGYVSPFYVAPLTSVDGGIGSRSSRPTGRRASASSRSIASDESKSVKSAWSGSGPQASRKGSQRAGSSKTSKKAPGDVDAASQDLESAARRTKSHTNLKAAAKEAEGTEPSHGRTAADRPPEPEEAATSSSALQARRPSLGIPAPSKASGASLTAAAAAPVSPSQNRLRSASSSSMFGQRLFRRPRTAGGDMSAHPVPSLQDPQAAEPSQRAASYDLLASPTDSIEFEMLDTSAKTLDVSRPQRGNSIGDVGRLSHDVPRAPNELTASGDREPRGRSNSIASIDVRNVGGRGGSNYGRASSDAYGADRASGDAVDRRGFSPSRLESSGGAANLFGGGGAPRQRTSSLLPTFGFGRTRTSSNAGAGSATPGGGRSGARSPEFGHDGSSSVAGLPAHESGPKSFAAALAGIAAGESLAQGGGGMRRKSSFRALTGSRKGSASGPGGEFKARNNSTSLHPEEYVPRTSRDSGDESRSAGRASISSTRRSSSSRTSFQRRPSSRNHDSATDLDSPGNAVAKRPPKETAPLSDESPEEYAERIADTVPKTEIAAVLASSADPFYTAALRHHMTIFWFNGNALDIALRKLLMDLHLPKETQQIDRVMEAFAKRYNECNDGLFASDDQPYILSFSLMMLHTDAFNKNAKHKMTKADYLRNTGPSGVPTEILEYLYDNLTFTQFIYVEDKDDLQRRANEAALGLSAFPGGSGGGNGAGIGGPSLYSAGATASQVARARIDPYYLIAQGKLGELRADIDHLIPEDTPFSYTGTLAGFDIDRLNAAFLHAPSIEIATGRSAATAAAPAAPPPSHWIGLEAAAHMQLHQPPPPPTQQPDEVVSLKVTKVGVVSRKDDVGDGGRKAASRKWKTCGLLLTGSQLLLFKDIVWTTALQSQILDQVGHSQLSNGIGPSGPDDAEPVEGGVVISPRITYFRPDGVISLADAVAVKDNTYVKYDFVFRLLASKGRQYLIQAQNEDDMNDWIHKINFCACFRTCDLKIRGLDLSSRASFAEAAASSSLGRRDSRSQARRPSAASEARSFASEGFKLSHSSTFSSMSDIDSQLGPDSGSTLSRPRSSAAMAAAAARPLSPTTTATPGADEDRDEDREELDEQGDEAYRSLSPDSRSRASSRASSSHIMPLLQKRLAARRELMLQKIEETGVALKKVTDVLDEELRLARHFAVLTPFQKMTRDRIEAAALPLSRKIKQLRLELAKEESRVRILKLDLAAGERLARSAVPSLRLSTSFVNDAKRAPGSQLATPQLLELSGMSETQAGFEDMFGSPPSTATGSGTGTSTAVATPTAATRSFDPEVTSPIEAAGRARLAQSQRRPSSDASAAAAGGSNAPPSHGTLPSSRITKPAHQQRHLTNLNSVSEQPADESPVLASAPRLGGPDDSFASSKPSDADADAEGDLASADATDVTDVTDADDEDDDGRLDAGGARREADRGGDRRQSSLPVEAKEATEGSVSPSRSSVSRSSASFEARRGDVSTDSLPVEADEEVPEEWDMSRLARDGGNRISLVDLPSPGELQEATTRRFIFGVSESSTVG